MPANPKLPYRSPTLTVFGDVRELTRRRDNMGGGNDSYTTLAGMGMNCQVTTNKTGVDIPFTDPLNGEDECNPALF